MWSEYRRKQHPGDAQGAASAGVKGRMPHFHGEEPGAVRVTISRSLYVYLSHGLTRRCNPRRRRADPIIEGAGLLPISPGSPAVVHFGTIRAAGHPVHEGPVGVGARVIHFQDHRLLQRLADRDPQRVEDRLSPRRARFQINNPGFRRDAGAGATSPRGTARRAVRGKGGEADPGPPGRRRSPPRAARREDRRRAGDEFQSRIKPGAWRAPRGQGGQEQGWQANPRQADRGMGGARPQTARRRAPSR